MMFGFSMGANFFLQIAKLRAVRPIWAQIVKAFGGGEEAQRIHVHARPALFFKTVYDPYVNMLRNTTEIFSGVVGGLDSFENAPFDEPIRKGDEFSRRIARNVQIMLQEEFGLMQPIDPAGGSWAVETLTKEIQEKIWAEFQTIEGKGGIVKALESGYVQEEVAKTLEDRFKKLELRRDRIVGNNMYPNMTEKLLDPRTEDVAELLEKRKKDVEAYLADVDETFKKECLAALKSAGKGEKAEAAVKAAKAGATIAELREALQTDAAAEKITAIGAHRWSERYEALRRLTEEYRDSHDGDNVKIFLANMGPIPQHKARADFSTSFLQVGAFEVLLNDGFKTTDEAAAAAKESGADASKGSRLSDSVNLQENASSEPLDKWQNIWQSGYFPLPEGQKLINVETVSTDNFVLWDHGFDFYAPQTFVDDSGRTILIGWMGIIDPIYHSYPAGIGFCHNLTLPRELSLSDNGVILQHPVKELDAKRHEYAEFDADGFVEIDQLSADIEISGISGDETLVLNDALVLSYSKGIFTMKFIDEDTAAGRTQRSIELNQLSNLRVIVDGSTVEIYLNDGRVVFSTRWFPASEHLTLSSTFVAAESRAYSLVA